MMEHTDSQYLDLYLGDKELVKTEEVEHCGSLTEKFLGAVFQRPSVINLEK